MLQTSPHVYLLLFYVASQCFTCVLVFISWQVSYYPAVVYKVGQKLPRSRVQNFAVQSFKPAKGGMKGTVSPFLMLVVR